MKITRNSLDTTPGPENWFTGSVFIDTIATPSEPSRVGAASVHFAPGARTAWHKQLWANHLRNRGARPVSATGWAGGGH
jgi:quercetin dioxygenase-like cupin family protein